MHTSMLPGFNIAGEVYRSRRRVVYRGTRQRDGTPVIIKTLTDQHSGAGPAARLRREYDLLRSLEVEGVVRAYDLVRLGSRPALILEDVGGQRLKSLIAAGRLDLRTVLSWGIGLAATIAEVHRRDIVHKDLTPNNILVDVATGRLTLIDFSTASRLPVEHQRLSHPSVLEGTIAYMSPEQTGRMNRGIDYRTDLYSLGVTFYEMLTGVLPFDSVDPLEVVHCHIAKTPASPEELDPGIPRVVSDIVMKLLAKTAEGRYQSALGVKADLACCLAEWEATGRVEHVIPGREDVSDRFIIPQQLYGRDREVAALLAAGERVCDGAVEFMMVSGYSGIGKTSLVQELYKPIVRQRGSFISGKFDQVVRTPYGALIQAFRGLIQQLLTESEEDLAAWRARLSEALGAGGGVLVEVIPELELVLGKQQPPPPLGPAEAQNRFRSVFQNFVGALARREHPLVLFLDDLQWVDSGTLSLLQPLLTSPDIGFFFLIGAYRDNEVDAAHPLVRTLGTLQSEGARMHLLSLEPLTLPDLTLLVRDTLHGSAADIAPLARLVSQKTDGNPFFVIQFLRALRQDGLLRFDYGSGRWSFRMDAIAEAAMTDNVIHLMTRKIQRLSPKAQRALTLAACVGNQFDLATLAIISEQTPDATAADLEEALAEGLVLPAVARGTPTDGARRDADGNVDSYAFLHDRVQQAAYTLIPDERKHLVHLTVGRLLLGRWDRSTAEEKLFDILHHLNLGRALIVDEAERLSLARLNLIAGRKAKASTAYAAALGYFTAGFSLLAAEHWDSEYELTLELHLESAECEYLTGDEERAERCVSLLLAQARTRLDTARVYALKIVRYEYMSRYVEAIRIGQDALALFGLSFPESPEERERALAAELAAVDALVGARPIASLVELPVMTDPEVRTVMRLLTALHTPCYLSGDKLLTLLNTTIMVRLSLEHGSIEESALAYVLHAMHVGPIRGEYEAAYEFGVLALRLNDRLPDPGLRAKVLMNFSWAVSIWRRPIAESFTYTREAFRLGNETGLLSDAGYALFNETYFTLLAARDLAALQPVCESTVGFLKRVKMHRFVEAPQVILQWGRALQGLTEAPTFLTGSGFNEDSYRRTYAGQHLFEMFYLSAKLALLYTFGEYRAACETAREAERVIREYTGTIWDELRVFHHALALAALSAGECAEKRADTLATLDLLNERLAWWAEHSPHNFRAQHLMVSAEIARVRGRDAEAMALYEKAIDAAAMHECPRERALANELYARFWQGRGQERVAAVFLASARDEYAQWGATAKVRNLERKYPDLLVRQAGDDLRARPVDGPTLPATAHATTEARASTLDVATVMKAAQTISGEMDLEKLLRKLVRIAIENAGAQRGLLFEERAGQLILVAEGAVGVEGAVVLPPVALESRRDVSHAVIHLVRRTAESLLVDDAQGDPRWFSDPYVAGAHPRSILCVPIVHQGKRAGLFYLENNLTAEAFTAERIELMRILAAQAAISLENARLYEEMRQEIERRSRAEGALRDAVSELEELKTRLQAENVYLQEEIRTQHGFEEIVGRSTALQKVLRQVEQVAPTDTTVLITGETGTGKELVARAIHRLSARRDRALVNVNCAAISAGLIESELFGHEKGAFTGALARKLGRFELADGGTIFLDEIGDLSPELQVKLLRALQEGEIERVGGTRPIRVDVRVIAATHQDLERAIDAGRFRSDLYYRLHVFPIRTPPLRERREDIPLLVRHFVMQYGMKLGKRIEAIPKSVLDDLATYAWPGNIRELRNVIERSIIVTKGMTLELGDWIPRRRVDGDEPSPRTLEEVERDYVVAVLERMGWRVSGPAGAARLLGLKPTTLEARMKKLGISRPK